MTTSLVEILAKNAHEIWLANQPADRVSIKFGHNIVTPWDTLDISWKEEQFKIFERYAKLVQTTIDCEKLPEMVHNVWMELNSWEKDYRPHLFKPYDELSDDEKEKDNVVVNILRSHL